MQHTYFYYPYFWILISMFVPYYICKETQKQEPCQGIQCRTVFASTINQANQLINKMRLSCNGTRVKSGIFSDTCSGDDICKRSGRVFVYHYAWWWNWRALSSVINKHLMARNMEFNLRFFKLNIANFVKYISIHNFLFSFCVEAKGVFFT